MPARSIRKVARPSEHYYAAPASNLCCDACIAGHSVVRHSRGTLTVAMPTFVLDVSPPCNFSSCLDGKV